MLGFLTTAGRSFLQGVLQLLYPGACWGCGCFLPPDRQSFCFGCQQALTAEDVLTCPRCASTVGPYANLQGGCALCRQTKFAFSGAFRLGPYEGLLRDVILQMKHHGGEGLAEEMGELWAAHAAAELAAAAADVVVPVPLHWSRYWTRGYNQSEVLARALAARLRVPCCPHWLRRCRATARQAHQPSPQARRENVRHAFRAGAGAPLGGRTVLLVDDVLTTGCTASAAAQALRKGGAARVIVAVLAHGH